MVSKVAVIAIVALVAIPIGMGYALNFEDFEVTKHQKDNEVNVTPLLRNSTVTNATMLNFYEMNTNNFYPLTALAYTGPGIMPVYRTSAATADSSLQASYYSGPPMTFGVNPARGLLIYEVNTGIDITNISDTQINIRVDNAELPNSHKNYTRVAGFWADPVDSSTYSVTIAYYTALNYQLTTESFTFSNSNQTTFTPTTTSGYNGEFNSYILFQELINNNSPNVKSILPENGYRLDPSFAQYRFTRGGVNEALITFDLSTVDYGGFKLNSSAYGLKMPITIRNGEYGQTPIIECGISDADDDPSAPPMPDKQRQEIIYESGQPNIYQLLITKTGYQLRYVGNSWPHNVGVANYYRTWDIDYSEMDSYYSGGTYSEGQAISGLRFTHPGYDAEYPNPTPGVILPAGAGASIGRMRVDAGLGLGATTPAIKDNTLDPSLYTGQRESITTIKSVSMTGTSITFGDFTLKAQDNNLIINGRSIPIRNLDFSILYDELNEEYTYSIGNTVIGVSEQKPTITFNGYWGADVAVSKVITTQVTESRWVAGHWAWNGLDNNFSMVGLMASVGAFIALGMYGRRSGAKVLPLMLVCGGAALVFLLMF